MNQITIQWDVVIALYIFFNWCHGGITNINCSGHIWVEPATIFKMGMNISIYCQAAIKNCQPRKLYFYKNGIKERFQITRINKTTARLWYSNFLEPHASMYCTAECPGYFQETLICGKDISSGYPPDVPDKVTCVIYEYSGNMTCTWNSGKPTYIDTKYVVYVKSLEKEEEQQYLSSSYINISTDSLQGGKKYLVWVQAANALGMEKSKQLQINLDDIVIPSAAIISRAEDINTTIPKTIIHWNSQTTIENVSCEMRHKTTTNQTWKVKEFDTNFPYEQQSEFYLEPNTKYIFQVRCQETGKRYWQPWSSPFFHKTAETVPQVTVKSFQHDTQNSELLIASIFKGHLTSDNRQQDIGLLLGMIFFAAMLSILSLIGIFNRSIRTGIKRRILLLIPKWLHEDIPNMENSKVVEMLQKQSEFMNNNSSEQVLYADPVITEIEIFLPEEHKPTDYKAEKNTGSLETRDCLQNSLLTNTTVVYIPGLSTGYKPQISNFLTGGNHLSKKDETSSSTLKPLADSSDLGGNARFKKYPNFAFSVSSMNSLSNTLFLEELSLILNQGERSPLDMQNSVEGETTMLLENASPNETIPEQTLLPDEFVSCLGIMNEELPSINSYFPQNILENHFNTISLLEK
ncbi:interleukin-23 receptor [Canis lupus baileyi]|uniref:Interleukin-23 receptor n=3 Tax=Canis lupus TaxID=9612 RepID=A0A8C0Q7W0_CANLF|nr:interleukin-23 receptor [Canis lupus dingo]XP_038393087.1 interleukin-23 receptor [Canis lupus familiaris]XP_038521782.1 interleukin-23 receptor [Canis lupus familiaris]XP_852151.1 interleukin-23 receptor [Canis lupus familiaris]|eukprot:XP_852151.1 interleukin-23 receptor [Canis lupus familiaris]